MLFAFALIKATKLFYYSLLFCLYKFMTILIMLNIFHRKNMFQF